MLVTSTIIIIIVIHTHICVTNGILVVHQKLHLLLIFTRRRQAARGLSSGLSSLCSALFPLRLRVPLRLLLLALSLLPALSRFRPYLAAPGSATANYCSPQEVSVPFRPPKVFFVHGRDPVHTSFRVVVARPPQTWREASLSLFSVFTVSKDKINMSILNSGNPSFSLPSSASSSGNRPQQIISLVFNHDLAMCYSRALRLTPSILPAKHKY